MDDEIRRKQKQKNRDKQAQLYPNREKRTEIVEDIERQMHRQTDGQVCKIHRNRHKDEQRVSVCFRSFDEWQRNVFMKCRFGLASFSQKILTEKGGGGNCHLNPETTLVIYITLETVLHIFFHNLLYNYKGHNEYQLKHTLKLDPKLPSSNTIIFKAVFNNEKLFFLTIT